MKHFKIVHGYNQDEYIPITENELAKAIAIFMQGTGRVMFENGAIRGQDIMRIVPDWHAAMGWNKGYKMTPEDHADVARFENAYRNTYTQAKLLAEYSIKENKPELLTKSLIDGLKFIPETPQQREIAEGAKRLASQMKRV